MTSKPPRISKYSSGVLSLLPLYYVGWSDNVLGPSEIKLIRQKINELQFLSEEDKALLYKWSDPANPPAPQLFKEWVRLLQNTAVQMPCEDCTTLAELGIEMARRNAGNEETLEWTSPQTRKALEDLETVLGVTNLEGYRNIFTPEQRENIKGISEKPGFDVKAMTGILDGRQAAIKSQVRTLLADPVFRYKTLRNKEDYRHQVLSWCRQLADQGLGALAYPADYGGNGDMYNYIAVFEMLGYHDLSLAIKFGVQFGLFGGSVLWLGTKRHHDEYLKDIGTLVLPGCFAMTETGHGSNVKGLETTATYDPVADEFVVHSPTQQAGKEYIGNALHGRMASVFAQLIVGEINHGVHAILVPLRDEQGRLLPGIRVEDNGYKMGLNGVDNGRIWFDRVRVPRTNLLNRFGDVDENGRYTSPIKNPSKRFFTMLGTLVGGRVSVPLAGLSAAKSGLAIAIKYGLKRRQFAPKEGEKETLILDYPSHQRRLMPLLAKAYALDFALSYLTQRYVNRSEADIREIETMAAGLKSYATWFTTHTLQECREACGGKGYLAINRLADLKADTDIFTTFEGDNTVLMQLVAKGLLSSFRQEFHAEGFRAVMRFLLSQVSTSITERNPYIIRKTDTEHLIDSGFHLNAFRFRERYLLNSISQRMRTMLRQKMDPYDAFLKVQTHMLALANAYVERIVLEQFVEGVEKCEDPRLRIILKKLCDLYALSTIEKHKGWFLENDYLVGAKTKAIRRQIDRLCLELRHEAGPLVDAFAIPEVLLAAPIAAP